MPQTLEVLQARGLTTELSLPATTTLCFLLYKSIKWQSTKVSIIKEEGTKAEPNPNANATIRVLLKYNARGTSNRL